MYVSLLSAYDKINTLATKGSLKQTAQAILIPTLREDVIALG